MSKTASRQVLFALVIAFGIMVLSGGTVTRRISKIGHVGVTPRSSKGEGNLAL